METDRFTHAGLTVVIEHDPDPESPREWDNMGTILYTSSRYVLGDKQVDKEEIRAITSNPDMIWLPVYAYIHSGVTLNTTGFSCPWDSGQCGIIYASREDVLKNWDRKRLTKKLRLRAEDLLRAEIETYDQFLQGNVFGFRILQEKACPACETSETTELDSCWGYYEKEYCISTARSEAEGWREHIQVKEKEPA